MSFRRARGSFIFAVVATWENVHSTYILIILTPAHLNKNKYMCRHMTGWGSDVSGKYQMYILNGSKEVDHTEAILNKQSSHYSSRSTHGLLIKVHP